MNEAVRSVHKVSCTDLKKLLPSHLPPIWSSQLLALHTTQGKSEVTS